MVVMMLARDAHAGPISPSRGLIIRPRWLDATAENEDSILTLQQFGGWGGVFHGFNSVKDDFGWGIDLGVGFEIARLFNEISLIGFSDMELTAKTDNDIYFNPKGAFWEEGILFTRKGYREPDFQWGYIHRCRHDVDNGDTTEFVRIPSERTLIYGSLTFRALFEEISLNHNPCDFPPCPKFNLESISPWLAADLYVFREDYRQPGSDYGIIPNFSNILFTISGGAYGDLMTLGPGYLYSRASVGMTAFGSSGSYFHSYSKFSKVTLDGDAEVGYAHSGAAAKVEFYLGWQGMNDDASSPLPVASHFLTLGFRLAGSDLVE
jgi:hypothetical protein